MRMIITGLSAVLLAGCGSGLVQLDNGGGSAPAPGNIAAPGAPGRPTGPGPSRTSREGMIAECSADLGRNLPQGTDIAALCACAVDRIFQRVPQRDAVRLCAAEQNVRLPGLD